MANNSSAGDEDLSDAAGPKGSTVFICYSHQDKGPANRLRMHLTMALGGDEGRVKVWSDHDIQAGEKWREEIRMALETATVAILMISLDWFNSKFIAEEEAPFLLERRAKGLLTIIPVITSECPFQNTWVAELQWLPKEGTLHQRVQERHQMLDLFTDKWRVIDVELCEIAAEVAKAVDPAAGKSDPSRGRPARARNPSEGALDAPATSGKRQVERTVPVGMKQFSSTKPEQTSIQPRQTRSDVTPEERKGTWS